MSSPRIVNFDSAAHKLAKAIDFDVHPFSFPSEEEIYQAIYHASNTKPSIAETSVRRPTKPTKKSILEFILDALS